MMAYLLTETHLHNESLQPVIEEKNVNFLMGCVAHTLADVLQIFVNIELIIEKDTSSHLPALCKANS